MKQVHQPVSITISIQLFTYISCCDTYLRSFSCVENGTDYLSTAGSLTFDAVNVTLYFPIEILDNSNPDGERYIVLGITSDCGIDIWIQIFI